MNPYESFFKDKRITVLGLGLLGRGVGDAEFLAQCGARVLVTDLKTEEQLAESISRLKKYENISFHLGSHDEKDFTDCDMVIKAAGVPLDSPYIAAAREKGIRVYMSTALFAKFAQEIGATIVGVTGTRGKSTVTHMIFHVLQKSGKRTHLGGNIRGKSTLALLPEIQKDDICVLELDSWQLQGFGDLQISPHIAVFTNFMPDHLNYYKGNMGAYFADKANIFLHQKEGDVLFAGASVAERIKVIHSNVAIPAELPSDWALSIRGEHNRENAAIAVAALEALGLKKEEVKPHIETFQGVEGRLQLVREINGVKIYNDNNATTPEATIAALKALDEGKKNIILVMGGADKGLDMKELWREIQERCKDLYFLAGTGIDRIRPEAPQVPAYNSLQEVLDAALKGAERGDIILFSPAFASFGMFKNEYDRNDQFLTGVRSL
ncbi:UDP-N-acetylmuramoyl-L-alanine--D-glutamate ligase [Candidatus Parcubacteria bacterium]|nr:MAG: UDP-N-acetylmuramoyl-L-alanine--D-glutamate ligase [Candidatus Parcubacteria bacterium]